MKTFTFYVGINVRTNRLLSGCYINSNDFSFYWEQLKMVITMEARKNIEQHLRGGYIREVESYRI